MALVALTRLIATIFKPIAIIYGKTIPLSSITLMNTNNKVLEKPGEHTYPSLHRKPHDGQMWTIPSCNSS